MTRLLSVTMAIALTVLLGSADAWAKPNLAAAEQAEGASSASSASSSTSRSASGAAQARPSLGESYASREASAKNLEKFEGGDVVVITSTTIVVILLVVLILVLI